MNNQHGEIALELETLPDTDSEELAGLVGRLRAELLDLEIDHATAPTVGEAPEGAKGEELYALGCLVVQFTLEAGVLSSIVEGVRSWLPRQSARMRSVRFTIGDDSLEVTGVSSAEQDRLVERWIARHDDSR